jgi:rhamnogalacturonan endolyase
MYESKLFDVADDIIDFRYMIRQDMAAGLAYVGLASPGQPGSWATESKNYQFWTRATTCGSL